MLNNQGQMYFVINLIFLSSWDELFGVGQYSEVPGADIWHLALEGAQCNSPQLHSSGQAASILMARVLQMPSSVVQSIKLYSF